MSEIIYNPLERFRDDFFPTFKQSLREAYDQQVRESGVDIEENTKTCDRIEQLQKDSLSQKNVLSVLKFHRILLLLIAIVGIPSYLYREYLLSNYADGALTKYLAGESGDTRILVITGAGLLAVCLLIPLWKYINKRKKRFLETLESAQQEEQKAWEQVAPLLSLLTWDLTLTLIHKTLSFVSIDPFFSQDRYDELDKDFGPIDMLESDDVSVVGVQSGAMMGNPYAMVKRRCFHMGEKSYTGYRTIHWTSYETDVDGKRRLVHRSQQLSATVVKPYPTYYTENFLVYGNDAAPNLKFHKEPSDLNSSTGFFTKMKLKRTMKKLEKLSRDLTDDSNYTMMTNKDFETRFNTSNRTDETEYRLLFTPLAQRQMLALLLDKEVGYGDDFHFEKHQKINIIKAAHMRGKLLELDASLYRTFDNRKIKNLFLDINEDYFRALYFAFAPLLAIPVYQQTRSKRSIWGEAIMPKSSTWELELLANRSEPKAFHSSDSETESIIKVKSRTAVDERTTQVTVVAHGFNRERLCDYVSVLGGDGRFHSVRVDWDHYFPVSKTTQMEVCELQKNEEPHYANRLGKVFHHIYYERKN